jgi:hypothetical protein
MLQKIAKDPVVIALVVLAIVFFGIYQIGGGQHSSNIAIRNCINIFWYAIIPVLLSYLIISPLLQKSLSKSQSRGKRFRTTLLGVLLAILIAGVGLVAFFWVIVGFAMG